MVSEGQFISLCEYLGSHYTKKGELLHDYKRIYDLKDGVFTEPYIDSVLPNKFDNRKTLPFKELCVKSDTSHDLTLIQWSFKPNEKNAESDYLTLWSYGRYNLLQLDIKENVSNDKELIRDYERSNLYKHEYKGTDIFVCYRFKDYKLDLYKYRGFIYKANDTKYDTDGKLIYPKNNTRYCKIYEINESETLKFITDSDKRQIIIYAKTEESLNAKTVTFLDNNQDKYLGDLFIRFMRKEEFKQIGIFDKDLRKNFSDIFKQGLSLDEFVKYIIHELDVDECLASRLVKDFRDSKGDIFTVQDFETETLIKIIKNSPDIRNFALSQLQGEWQESNAEKLTAAEKKLKYIENEINESLSLKEQLEHELDELRSNKSEALANISNKAHLFRTDLEACMHYLSQFMDDKHQIIHNDSYPEVVESVELKVIQSTLKCTELYSYEDACYALADNLEKYEVFDSRLSSVLAEFLMSICSLRLPLLISGPFGFEITNTIAASLYGHDVSAIDVTDRSIEELIHEINDDTSEIVLLRGVFVSGKIDMILSCLDRLEKHIVLLHPYPDDLLLSNHGYYLYLVPLCTDVFIRNEFVSKKTCSLDYARYSFEDTQTIDKTGDDTDEPSLDRAYVGALGLSPYEVCRWQAIFTRMSNLNPFEDDDIYLLFMAYPLLRCLRQLDKFEELNGQFSLSMSVLKRFFRKLSRVIAQNDAQ